MRTFYRTFTRLTAAALIVAMSAAPGVAAKTPRRREKTRMCRWCHGPSRIWSLIKTDPPKGIFDPTKLTIFRGHACEAGVPDEW